MSSSSASTSSTTEQLINRNENETNESTDVATREFYSPFLPYRTEQDHQLNQRQQNENEHFNENKPLTALIILNSPIESPPSPIFTKLWEISTFRVCADGGANRLFYATVAHNNDSKAKEYIPDLIKGDLDSLQPNVRDYYQNLNGNPTMIERDGDQDCNDLDKSLNAVSNWISERRRRSMSSDSGNIGNSAVQIYVYGAFGGRFDQEMASIQALYRWKDEFQYNIALYTDETFAILLAPHVRNEIRLPFYSKSKSMVSENDGEQNEAEQNLERIRIGEGPTVGLIPIGCKCEGVKTEGLKWNLDGTIPLEFGGLVSTSNRAEDKVVVVECLQPLVFTAEMTRVI